MPPLPNGENGRTTAGRFAPGNPGGPGNPYARRVASLRRALLDAVTPDDLAELARALVGKAKAGDVAACKLLLPYMVGPPPELDPEVEARLEHLEELLTGNAGELQ